MMTVKNHHTPLFTAGTIQFTRLISDRDHRRLLLLVLLPLSLFVFLTLSAVNNSSAANAALNSVNWFGPLGSLWGYDPEKSSAWVRKLKEELDSSRMAVCLVGGARRFELTGPSIVHNILNVYPNADLFLHSPMDSNAFKLSSLKNAPRIASVRIFEPKPVPETESQLRVLTPLNSPNGIQGLLQYFNLVEGCVSMIKEHQNRHNFTYDWIVRTRVDSYWNAPLPPDAFIPSRYLVPSGSSYGGLNDRLGVGDLHTSVVALSRLSLLPLIDSAGFRNLNSETSFKAQLSALRVPYVTRRLPFCIITDRRYDFPPDRYGVPVAALSSPGPLSGAKCRPCKPACTGPCVGDVMSGLDRGWSWTDWQYGALQLCDARGVWEEGWEYNFDAAAGAELGAARRRISNSSLEQCVHDFEEMRRRSGDWDSPLPAEICSLGLSSR